MACNWGDPKAAGTLIQDRWRQFPNGTPYIVWSPWGGPNGTLLATGRSVVRDDIGRVGQGMFINRNGGEGVWTLIETPINYNINNDGYSQTMIPLGDGQEILQLVDRQQPRRICQVQAAGKSCRPMAFPGTAGPTPVRVEAPGRDQFGFAASCRYSAGSNSSSV